MPSETLKGNMQLTVVLPPIVGMIFGFQSCLQVITGKIDGTSVRREAHMVPYRDVTHREAVEEEGDTQQMQINDKVSTVAIYPEHRSR